VVEDPPPLLHPHPVAEEIVNEIVFPAKVELPRVDSARMLYAPRRNGVVGITDQVPPVETRVVARVDPDKFFRLIVAHGVPVPERVIDREASVHERGKLDTGEITGAS
jgi:hypothetical protein